MGTTDVASDRFTDVHYQQPSYMATATQSYDECQYMSEWNMFRILDSLNHTATGLDKLPAWFLRLGAPASDTFLRVFL